MGRAIGVYSTCLVVRFLMFSGGSKSTWSQQRAHENGYNGVLTTMLSRNYHQEVQTRVLVSL
ncbi:hypothetical protein J2T12_004930 [Paenibacillus anaericanus]|nr:hypothetical protein [Paenibacillus anaericanus]